ncbi:MAG: GLPGLI family protein [Bacteroidota bacterium]
MKTIKILAVVLLAFFSTNATAQDTNKDKNIVKVGYTSGCVSDFLVGIVKKQVQDPAEFSNLMAKMEAYKIHSSFYQNVKTKESVYVIDSITEVGNLKTTGYTYFAYRNKDGQLFGKELFMGKDINFQGSVSDMEWTITDEQKEINGYQCKKAHIKGNPKVYVWFAPEIPVSGGPYVFYGLPGLVLESDSHFEAATATSIGYESTMIFEKKLTEVKDKVSDKKAISLEEVFAKKENFQRMIANGK